ncbi:hypothetical protein [Chicken microvirus mg7_6]|nr:hypothetical protein [Chicken microvirus mg7_6]
MTTIYKYYIRYYNITKNNKKYYLKIESPAYAFENICSESMQNTIRNIVSNPKYTIDSYWIESILVDSISDISILTLPDLSDLPF